MMTNALPFENERRDMLEFQLRPRGIRDDKVLAAMFNVPRHEFVPAIYTAEAYGDRPLPIGESETISQPYIVAAMTQAARVRPGEKALEVGAGSGYQAAILAYLGAQVYAVERNPRLAEESRERLARLGYDNVQVIRGDGTEGYAPAQPYAVILVTAAAPEVPPPVLEQLAPEGRLVIPVGDIHHQDLILLYKGSYGIVKRVLDPCMFVPLIGKYGWPEHARWVP